MFSKAVHAPVYVIENDRSALKRENAPSLRETLRPIMEVNETYFEQLCEGAELCFKTPLWRRNEKKLPNCISSALRMVGETQNDFFKDPYDAYKDHLKGLDRVDVQQLGCLVAWQVKLSDGPEGPDYVIHHLAVVTSLDPFLISDRIAIGLGFIANEPFRDAHKEYEYTSNIEVAFYLPKALKSKEEEALKPQIRKSLPSNVKSSNGNIASVIGAIALRY